MPTARQMAANQRRIARERFRLARQVEREYQRQLVAVGRHIGDIVSGFIGADGIVWDQSGLTVALQRYSDLLAPWAQGVTKRMHAQVAQRDLTAWRQLSREVGAGLEREIAGAPVGNVLRELLENQVHLIRSMPLEAAKRVHDLTLTNIVAGVRADQIAKEIQAAGKHSAYAAIRIARTETSRTASALCEARATYIGSTQYTWRAVMDEDTRPLHRKLNGQVFRWDDPPVSGNKGERSAPGSIYFCRCWCEPILADRL